MEQPFKYRVLVGWSDEDDAYVARVPALPGCGAHGSSVAEAAAEVREAAGSMLAAMIESGDPLPAPEEMPTHSGNIRLRLPRSLHAQLEARAEIEGVSLNQLMVALLAEGAGYLGALDREDSRAFPPAAVARERSRIYGRKVPSATGAASGGELAPTKKTTRRKA